MGDRCAGRRAGGPRAVAHRALGGGVVRVARRARRLVFVGLGFASARRPRARTHGSNCALRSGSSGRGVPSGGRGRRRSCRGCRSTGIRTCSAGRFGVGLGRCVVYAEKNWGPRFTEHWWWGQAQAFEGTDACVAFAGGRVLGGAPTGVVVRVEDRILRLAPPFAQLRTSIGDDVVAGPRPVRPLGRRARGRGGRLAGRPTGPGARRAPGHGPLPAVPHRPPPRHRPPLRPNLVVGRVHASPASNAGSREPANGGWEGSEGRPFRRSRGR